MMRMSVAQVAEAAEGRMVAPAGVDAKMTFADAAVSDSRQVTSGSVFVAIVGERVDGHDFVSSAASQGAVAAIVEHEVEGAGLIQIVVDDAVRALGRLARRNLELRRAAAGEFSIIGITGSVGKTTTKDMLASMLSALGSVVAPVGSFNNEIGLPLTALKVGETTRFLVAEMGANHIGEIAGLTTIAPPDVAVVLKVGVAHLGEFGGVEHIAQAKSEIVRGLVPGGTAVLNACDKHVAAMAAIAPGKVVRFGLEGEAVEEAPLDVAARGVETDGLDRARFTLTMGDAGESLPVSLSIPGAHNVMNALAAASVASLMGMAPAAIAEALGKVSRISPHRMAIGEVSREGAEFTLIDDSFNANPDSMRAGLDGLARWAGHDSAADDAKPFRVAVLGAMLELGGDEIALHTAIGRDAAELGLDAIVAVGSTNDPHFDALAAALASGASDAVAANGRTGHTEVVHAHDIDETDRHVLALARKHPHTVVLLKGSHASGLNALAERWEPSAQIEAAHVATPCAPATVTEGER